jgi:uncharacterized membrane protein YhaH (DUF805 family)
MLKVVLTIIMLIVFVISLSILIRQRRMQGITGFKSILTPICFYLIGVTGIIGLWTQSFGIVLFSLSVILLFLAAYFTRYFPNKGQES